MFHPTEQKFQGWRALAVFEDGGACLLYVGRSTTQVQAGYAAAYEGVLDRGERARVRRINLQCWRGVADQGHWVTTGCLDLPGRGPAASDDRSHASFRELAGVA